MAFLFATAVRAVPLFLVRYVPLVDLPGQLEETALDWNRVLQNFDCVSFYGFDESVFQKLNARCVPVASPGKAAPFRVVKQP